MAESWEQFVGLVDGLTKTLTTAIGNEIGGLRTEMRETNKKLEQVCRKQHETPCPTALELKQKLEDHLEKHEDELKAERLDWRAIKVEVIKVCLTLLIAAAIYGIATGWQPSSPVQAGQALTGNIE